MDQLVEPERAIDTSLPLWQAAVRLAVLAPAVTAIVLAPWLGFYLIVAVPVALVSAALIGAPVLWIARRCGVTSALGLVGVGTAAGALPFTLVSLGLIVAVGGADRVLIQYVMAGAGAGAATGLVYWTLFLWTPWSPRRRLAGTAAVVAVALLVGVWPTTWWPKFRQRVERHDVIWAFGDGIDPEGRREVRLWDPADAACVASYYDAALVEYLSDAQPTVVELAAVYTTAWGSGTRLTSASMGPVQLPHSQVFAQRCVPRR